MSRPFLLCDPGLLVAPTPADTDQGLRFWPRIIMWASDRRVRLGPAGQAMVFDAFGELGWPTYEPPGCPVALQRAARRALNTLLAQVAVGQAIVAAPELEPLYEGPPGAANAIASDARGLHDQGLVGLATTEAHWPASTTHAHVVPPPPSVLPFALEAYQQLPGEVDHAIAEHLANRRIIIVGGEQSDHVVEALCESFGITPDQVVWVPSERNQRLNLNALEGLKAETDIVYCITGFVSHAGSKAADKRCKKRGLGIREVRYASRIVNDLRSRQRAAMSSGEDGGAEAAGPTNRC